MQVADAIVVGGGPAGSSCAWKLREAGLDVLVLDRAAFPRPKLCAGWVTPEAMSDLELDPNDYPLSIMTFDELHLHWKMLSAKPKSRQHSIRRYEFDDFLLHRAGATVLQHKVREIQRDDGDYVIDDAFRCKYLVGAGGTACPVYRELFTNAIRATVRCRPLRTNRSSPTTGRTPRVTSGFSTTDCPGTRGTCPRRTATSTLASAAWPNN